MSVHTGLKKVYFAKKKKFGLPKIWYGTQTKSLVCVKIDARTV
jgi:hypothetical protein